MKEHYFSKDPQVVSDVRQIEVTLRGETYRFYTDRGVFSYRDIDPGSRILIENMEIADRGTVLDLGCGYGPIGIVAARLSPKALVYLVDVNQRAVELCQKNIDINSLENATAFASDGFASIDQLRFDMILCNPPIRAGKRVVYPLISQSFERLYARGSLWLVVRKKQGAASMTEYVHTLFGNCQIVKKKAGYVVLKAVKTS
ncbi:MAG: class I SAM-dependent methyltransferase [Limnochordia bacterium]|nr:class I SAM-dependent methyltransferase [Limnochordia bacterium]MDD4517764.1 class I SAM-dependent methyltransferase [Limnochordia bacterium]